MRSSRAIRVTFAAFALVACGTDEVGPPDDPTPPDPDPGDPFPPPELGVQISSGPISIEPGEEKTLCAIVELPSDDELPVVKMEQHNNGTSHHFILFRAGSALEPGVGECPGGLFVQHAPIYPGTRSQGAFAMPDGVAITLAAKQTLILQLHLLNPTDETIVEEEKINLHAGVADRTYEKAGVVGASDYDFRIPPGETYTATQTCWVPTAMNLFALTSHSHARTIAVDVRANVGGGAMDLYHNESWSEPEFGQFDPGVELGGFDTIELSCTWFNETADAITYGETANDEMCMMFGYFYPATLDATPCIGL